jgi:hypothetical protein
VGVVAGTIFDIGTLINGALGHPSVVLCLYQFHSG